LIRKAALAGLGLGYPPAQEVLGDVAEGRLVRILESWCELSLSYHLYYPSRRQPTAAFTLFVETLRYRQ
jgi:DNA-binding transcriptional LysR family regulator